MDEELERMSREQLIDEVKKLHLPFVSAKPASAVADADFGRLRRLLREHEDLAVQQALILTRGNKAEAARVLGIHRASLSRRPSEPSGTPRVERGLERLPQALARNVAAARHRCGSMAGRGCVPSWRKASR